MEIRLTLATVATVVLLSSCSKRVYTHSDAWCKSKIVLYKDNYYYKEDTNFEKFSITGTYEVTDSSIQLVYRDKKRLPYAYTGGAAEITYKNTHKDYQAIKVQDHGSKEPILLAPIVARDSLGNIVSITETDLDGNAVLKKNGSIYFLEIQYVGYTTTRIIYKPIYEDYNLKILLEELRPGGRMSSGCLIHYIDVILEFKVDDPLNITEITKRDVTFRLEEKE